MKCHKWQNASDSDTCDTNNIIMMDLILWNIKIDFILTKRLSKGYAGFQSFTYNSFTNHFGNLWYHVPPHIRRKN